MSCNVLLHDNTLHTRTLPLLANSVRPYQLWPCGNISSFIVAITYLTKECAMGVRT
jgi:hypothetical protein